MRSLRPDPGQLLLESLFRPEIEAYGEQQMAIRGPGYYDSMIIDIDEQIYLAAAWEDDSQWEEQLLRERQLLLDEQARLRETMIDTMVAGYQQRHFKCLAGALMAHNLLYETMQRYQHPLQADTVLTIDIARRASFHDHADHLSEIIRSYLITCFDTTYAVDAKVIRGQARKVLAEKKYLLTAPD